MAVWLTFDFFDWPPGFMVDNNDNDDITKCHLIYEWNFRVPSSKHRYLLKGGNKLFVIAACLFQYRRSYMLVLKPTFVRLARDLRIWADNTDVWLVGAILFSHHV